MKEFKFMEYNERINYYLGQKLIHSDINIMDYDDKTKIQQLIDNPIPRIYPNLYYGYEKPLQNLLIKTNNQDKYFKCFLRDNINCKNFATLVKNRIADCNDSVILRCLKFDRHWVSYYNRPKDIPFNDKKNIVFWRGAINGRRNKKGSRLNLVTRWFNQSEYIDIGLIYINDYEHNFPKYTIKKCSKEHFLKYKYILSIPGNDKDSGLNWKLNSNSVVLMPRPQITSWLMESTLIPNYHYILLKDDFSDLEIKLDWCNNNQDECIQIVKNANNFMDQFKNKEKEEQLEIDVINTYFKLIKA